MKTPFALLTLAAWLVVGASLTAADWPQWRGPNRDGVVADPNHPISSFPAEPKVLWKINVGPGIASPVLAGNALVYLDGQSGQEVAHCVETATGKPVWTSPIAPMVTFSGYG